MKVGVAFSDFIKTEKPSKKVRYREFERRDFFLRGYLLLAALFILFGLLFIRLFDLQIVKGRYYRELSDSNRIRTHTIHAPRGIIFDRNKTPLVFNVPGFRKTKGKKTLLIPREKALLLIAKGEADFEVDSLRQYPYKEEFSHALGYIGQISKEELRNPLFLHYDPGDLIGKMGIEQRYEEKLSGVDGKELVEVDSRGKAIRTLGKTDPIPGLDISLTVDAALQKAAFLSLQHVKKAGIVVSTPQGEILTLVSKPTFDPNLFTMDSDYQPASDSAYQDVDQVLIDTENQPLLNRAISGTYPPGSTFKLITAAAGLEDSVIDESYQVEDTGIIHVGAFSFSNWYFTQYGKKEGTVDIVKGIKRSNDIFFYKLAERVGVESLSEWAKKFGVGDALGIDLEGEAKGLVPTEKWKKDTIGESWYLGDTYHYGIGQGFLSVTPLQVNAWTQVIANGGLLYEPHLLKNQKSNIKNKKFLSEKTVSLIRQGMVESCSPGGVAWPLFEFRVKNSELTIDGKNFLEVPQATTSAGFEDYRKVTVACKTGTAEHGGKDTLPHAWITLFAPAFDPEIVVTVLVEESGEGSNVAAPIAKKILEAWFSR